MLRLRIFFGIGLLASVVAVGALYEPKDRKPAGASRGLASTPARKVAREEKPKFFYESMKDDRDIPFDGPNGQVTRLQMMVEMGSKHPVMDCSWDCRRAKNARQAVGCKLGILGATYLLTGFQESTGRSKVDIWQIPNSSLNIEPYAYMKEMEAGIPCEESGFIKKFPTRQPRSGEKDPPVDRVTVCKAWQHFFREAGSEARHFDTRVQYAGREDRGEAYERALKGNQEIERLQKLMWKAHTYSILHSYWNHYDKLKREANPQLPDEEYEMWMAWNRIVGEMVPTMNLNSCALSAESVGHQLMPNCVVGSTKPDGTKCMGEDVPDGSFGQYLDQVALNALQHMLKTPDFDVAVDLFRGIVDEKDRPNRASCR